MEECLENLRTPSPVPQKKRKYCEDADHDNTI